MSFEDYCVKNVHFNEKHSWLLYIKWGYDQFLHGLNFVAVALVYRCTVIIKYVILKCIYVPDRSNFCTWLCYHHL